MRYHQQVHRLSDAKALHDEIGYWMWDGAEQIIMHSLTIPRAVCILAGATYAPSPATTERIELKVSARIDDPDGSIIQSPFMRDKAKTIGFEHQINVDSTSLTYKQTMVLDIYGKIFDHRDENTLSPCGH